MTYANYLNSLNQIKNYIGLSSVKSDYWDQESSSIQYWLEASPKLIERFLEHSHWLTGLRSYDYKTHHNNKKQGFEKKLRKLEKVSNDLPFLGELDILGAFGHIIDSKKTNIDTLKFYESCIALNKYGLLKILQNEKKVVCEIGAGWGGMASHILRYAPKTKYIIIDIPEVMVMSSTFIKTAFPDKQVMFGIENLSKDFDVCFIGCDDINLVKLHELYLCINMVSFQEMTDLQVRNYAKFIKDNDAKYLYSLNRSKSAYNNQIKSIYESLSTLGVPEFIYVLGESYTQTRGSLPQEIFKSIILKKRNIDSSSNSYRHALFTISN